MIRIFLLLGLLGLQGIPTRPDETGVVTGTLRTASGKPAVGIRVAARAQSESLLDPEEGAVLAGLAETDGMGSYRLEGVPVGRYTITAGRVDLPTYYPGTLEPSKGRILTILPGSKTSGIDFTLSDLSYALAGASALPQGVTITLKVRVGGGDKIPVFADGKFVQLAMVRDGDDSPVVATSLTALSITLPFPFVPGKYRASVENLPPGFTLKSLTYGSANLMTDALALSADDLGVSGSAVRSSADLSVALDWTTPALPATDGVRVSGRLAASGVRSVYLSHMAGIVYSDGTFEFRGVPPGKHVIVSSDQDRSPLGAVIVVGDRDMEGVQLEPVLILPREAPPVTAEMRPPGTVIPLGGLQGQIVSEASGQPMHGTLSVIGDSLQAAYAVGDDGRFQIPKLLPGSYNLQVSIFDHFTLNQTVIVGEKDTVVELRVRRAY